MNNLSIQKPTIESVAAEVRDLHARLEDMEDLIELREAVARNAGKPGIPWDQAKKEIFGDSSQM